MFLRLICVYVALSLGTGVALAESPDRIKIGKRNANVFTLSAEMIPFSSGDGSVDFREDELGIRVGAYDKDIRQAKDAYPYFSCFATIGEPVYAYVKEAMEGGVIFLELETTSDAPDTCVQALGAVSDTGNNKDSAAQGGGD